MNGYSFILGLSICDLALSAGLLRGESATSVFAISGIPLVSF
jgi:hypothetical protein